MSNSPETNAKWNSLDGQWQDRAIQICHHAQALEQERNDARDSERALAQFLGKVAEHLGLPPCDPPEILAKALEVAKERFELADVIDSLKGLLCKFFGEDTPLAQSLFGLPNTFENVLKDYRDRGAQSDALRFAGAKVAAVLRKYQSRYHGTTHAQEHWKEGDQALKLWSELPPVAKLEAAERRVKILEIAMTRFPDAEQIIAEATKLLDSVEPNSEVKEETERTPAQEYSDELRRIEHQQWFQKP